MGLFLCHYCGFQANMKPMVDHHMLSLHTPEVESGDEKKVDFLIYLDIKGNILEDNIAPNLKLNILPNDKQTWKRRNKLHKQGLCQNSFTRKSA